MTPPTSNYNSGTELSDFGWTTAISVGSGVIAAGVMGIVSAIAAPVVAHMNGSAESTWSTFVGFGKISLYGGAAYTALVFLGINGLRLVRGAR